MVNGHYLAGERAKEARRIKLGIPEGTPAGQDYVQNVWTPAQQAAQAAAAAQQGSAPTAGSDSSGGGFLDSLPNKIFGQPTWMLLVGGAIFVMYFFKGSSRGRR